MAAPAAAPLDEGKAKKVLRQVCDPRLVAPDAQLFFAILLKSTYLIRLPQVEFYFSDSNLPRDKFLRETVEQSDDGCNAQPPRLPAVRFVCFRGRAAEFSVVLCQPCSGELALDMLLLADEVPPGAGRRCQARDCAGGDRACGC